VWIAVINRPYVCVNLAGDPVHRIGRNHPNADSTNHYADYKIYHPHAPFIATATAIPAPISASHPSGVHSRLYIMLVNFCIAGRLLNLTL